GQPPPGSQGLEVPRVSRVVRVRARRAGLACRLPWRVADVMPCADGRRRCLMSLTGSFTGEAMYSPRMQWLNQGVALVLIVAFANALRVSVGIPPTIIVTASALIGFFCWRQTNLRHPIDPMKTAILFLLTVAALHVHMYEEHRQLFGPAMSRLFGIA